MLNWTKALKVWRSYGQGLGRLVVLVGGGLLVARLAGATTVIAHFVFHPGAGGGGHCRRHRDGH